MMVLVSDIFLLLLLLCARMIEEDKESRHCHFTFMFGRMKGLGMFHNICLSLSGALDFQGACDGV